MQKAIEYIKTELNGLYPDLEIRSFTNILISEITGFSRTEIIVNKNTIFSEEQVVLLYTFVEKLKKHVPIQYVLGKSYFMDLEFQVNDAVLIPRPETEELVEWIAGSIPVDANLSMLDIGTGSGCIAISLKNIFINADISAYDVSEKALTVAAQNAKFNNLHVSFEYYDILSQDDVSKSWDLIVSNPPYIPEKEKSEILPNVLNNEPHLALFVPDNDPLIFYRKIACYAQKCLKEGGWLFFEIHRDYGLQTVNLLSELEFTEIELRKDLSGNDRMIKARKS